jgi:outer membrane usher protein
VRIDGVPGSEAMVGYDGEAYLDALKPGENRLHIQTMAGTCAARFDYLASEGTVPRVGPLICTTGLSP